jgi:hypothetical protein
MCSVLRRLTFVIGLMLVTIPAWATLTPLQVEDLTEIIARADAVQADGTEIFVDPELEPELQPLIQEIIDDAAAIEVLAQEVLAIG